MRLLFSLVILLVLSIRPSVGITPAGLECEYRVDPLGIDETCPRLGWQLLAEESEGRQTAYRILVASTAEKLAGDLGDLWDSGKIHSSRSDNIIYGGSPLNAFDVCHWKVKIWDKKDHASGWSSPARFTIGPLSHLDWNADWISTPGNEPVRNFPLLRKEFSLMEIPSSAYAFVNVLGYFELYINGQKVGRDVLSPAVSDYSKHSVYRTYDISPFLNEGENCVGIWMAHGWYRRDGLKYPGVTEDRPLARVLLEFKQDGGPSVFLPTDRNWKYHLSERSYTGGWQWGRFGGEELRSGNSIAGWSLPGKDESGWQQVANFTLPSIPAIAQRNHPTRIIDTIDVSRIISLGGDGYLVDFGKHLNGWIDFYQAAPQSDTLVVIDYIDKLLGPGGERDPLEKNFALAIQGDPDTREMITYGQQDLVYPEKNRPLHFRNKFNYHAFRWIRLKGIHNLEPGDLKAFLVSEDMEQVSEFECSNPLLNRIWSTVNHTYRCLAYNGYVVDCPHRERVGYGGDSHSSLETALSNYDMAALCNKWTVDWNRANYPIGMWPHSAPEIPQHKNKFSPGWGGFGLFLPWQSYIYYGDTLNLDRAWPFIQRWMEYLYSITHEGILYPDSTRGVSTKWSFHGDWVAPNYTMQRERRVDMNSTHFFNNCYYLYNLDLASRAAVVLGKSGDALKYSERLKYSKEKVHSRFFNPQTMDYANGEQPYQAFPLYMDLVPGELKDKVENNLEYLILEKNKGHLNTGMLGTYFMFEYLMDIGRHDLIYTMVSQKTFPGWGYMIENGATTIWEQWNGQNSQIHNCYLAVGKWFVQGLGGIRPDKQNPGFSHFFIAPGLVDELEYVNVSYNTRKGLISSNWKRKKGQYLCEVRVPVNTTATFVLPHEGVKRVTLNGNRVTSFSSPNTFEGPGLELSPGIYHIHIYNH